MRRYPGDFGRATHNRARPCRHLRCALLKELGDSSDVEFFCCHAEHDLNDVILGCLHAHAIDFEKYQRRGPRDEIVENPFGEERLSELSPSLP